MKRQAVMKACMFGILLALAFSAQADEALRNLAGTLTKFTNQKLTEPGRPAWLKRTTVQFGVAGKQPTWMVKTLQPVRQTRDETVFLQGRVRQDGESVVSNIGSGYRWLTAEDNLALGLNGFYDQELRSSTERFSIGGEVFSENASLRANLYNAVGGPADTSGRLALDGFDLQLEAPNPLLRNTRLSLKTYQWHPATHIGAVQGWSAALKTNPNHKLNMELGASRRTRDETALFVNLTYHFGHTGKRKPAIFDRLAPQRTRIVREYNLQAGSS